MSDDALFLSVTRVFHHGDGVCASVAFGAFEDVCNATRDGRRWLECEDEFGSRVLLSLEHVQYVVQMTSEARLAEAERAQLQKLRFPD